MIHLNHAGTSWPKPEAVMRAVQESLGTSPGDWEGTLASQQAELAGWLGVPADGHLLLAPGATSALAFAIGSISWVPGDRLLVSGFEHDALLRPARMLTKRGVELSVLGAGGAAIDLAELEAELRSGGVRLVATTAACNVTGELLPSAEISALARRFGARSLLDAAQVAGWLPLDGDRLGADLIVFAGHKGPQAPWGIGGLASAEPLEAVYGPDSAHGCAVGSLDRAALAGLVAGLRWLAWEDSAARLERARSRIARMATAVGSIRGVRVHGADDSARRMPVLALTQSGRAPRALARGLAERGVHASAGLQCAPLAHRTLGTAPDGVLRLSVGPTTTDEDVATAIGALQEVLLGEVGTP